MAFVVRRTAGAAVTCLVASTVVFGVVVALPGDPARTIAGGRRAPEATLAAIRTRYHLDESLASQYLHWLGRLLRGDLGESSASRRPVTEVLADALPVTLTLLLLTLAIEVVAGLVVGTLVAVRQGGRLDRVVLGLCAAGVAAPVFVIASLAQYVLGVRWRVVPVAGTDDGLLGFVLPSLVLAIAGTSFAVQLMRSEVLDQMHLPHVRTAVAKGLSSARTIRRHVVRNSLTAVVTFFGLELGVLMGGTVVVERVFNLPGVGGTMARAISQRDNAVVIGLTLFVIVAYVVVDLLVDLATMWLDPRRRVDR
jgi:ABC-type dipeptide/oligopeptide/nickel transport system permease component